MAGEETEVSNDGRGSALAQMGALMLDLTSIICLTLLRSLLLAVRLLLSLSRTKPSIARAGAEEERTGVVFYQGKVWHQRRKPIVHEFEYNVRYVLVNLDAPPSWFTSIHHMTSSEARSIAATTGPVHLLTMPTSMGYEQNPLSVYYCYDEQGEVAQCIAEGTPCTAKYCQCLCAEPSDVIYPIFIHSPLVTNTPWAERVTFLFAPGLDFVAKPLHVSPFMDMKGVWQMQAAAPGQELLLRIGVQHPQYGTYFQAILKAKRVTGVGDPEAFTWLMPHKVAFWIYWQAIRLLWNGVSFIPHPKYIDGNAYRDRAQAHSTHTCPPSIGENKSKNTISMCPMAMDGDDGANQRYCTWREAPGYPWR